MCDDNMPKLLAKRKSDLMTELAGGNWHGLTHWTRSISTWFLSRILLKHTWKLDDINFDHNENVFGKYYGNNKII
jgi:hypothetical protein